MEASTARTIVRIISVLEYIVAALLVIGAIALFAAGSIFASNDAGILSVLGAALGFILIVLAAICLVVGIGLWKEKNWARIIVIILSVIGLLGGIGALVSKAVGSGVFEIVMNGVLLWLFAFQKDVIALFKK
jgi:hypothetical protein